MPLGERWCSRYTPSIDASRVPQLAHPVQPGLGRRIETRRDRHEGQRDAKRQPGMRPGPPCRVLVECCAALALNDVCTPKQLHSQPRVPAEPARLAEARRAAPLPILSFFFRCLRQPALCAGLHYMITQLGLPGVP